MSSKHKYLYGSEPIRPIPMDAIYSRFVAIEKRLNEVMSQPYESRDNGLKDALLKDRSFWSKIELEQKEIK